MVTSLAVPTLERYKDAFYEPLVSDWQNNENWQAAGSLTATERATAIWQHILETTEPPAIDPGIEEELHAYVAKRKEEIGQGALIKNFDNKRDGGPDRIEPMSTALQAAA